MRTLAIAVAAMLVVLLAAACVLLWRKALKEIDVRVADWDRWFYDEFYGEIGRISQK